jgi:hypothetical protein
MTQHEHPRYDDDPSGESPAHERSDAQAKPIIKFAIGLTVFVILVDAGLRWMTKDFLIKDDPVVEEPVDGSADFELSPPPRLQRSASADMQRLREDENERLTTYGWVDRQQNTVRVPIDQAMHMVVERMPDWPKVTGPAANAPGGPPPSGGPQP